MTDFTGVPCGVQLRDGDCWTPSIPDTPFPICPRHFIQISAYKATLQSAPQDTKRHQRADQQPDPEGVVYYLRLDEKLIKIGFTENITQRVKALYRQPADLLAMEPGTYSTEARRHQQFEHLRTGRGERFTAAPELVRHIGVIRAKHGKPTLRHPVLAP